MFSQVLHGDGQPSSVLEWSTKFCFGVAYGVAYQVLLWNGLPSSVLGWLTKFCFGVAYQVPFWSGQPSSACEWPTKFCMWIANQVLHGSCQSNSAWESYMPYLTLWDKISQTLAYLGANSHKIFKSHRIFRPSYNIFYEEININHTLLCLSQAFYI